MITLCSLCHQPLSSHNLEVCKQIGVKLDQPYRIMNNPDSEFDARLKLPGEGGVISEELQAEMATAILVPSGGRKDDGEKADMSLLSPYALEKIAQVMTFGKKKYSANNWRKGFPYTRLLAAVLRHVMAYMRGESKDPETGISHLAHACCGLFMILEFEDTHPELDDRYFKGEKK